MMSEVSYPGHVPFMGAASQLPRCIQKLQVPGHIWLTLNQRYKPLGSTNAAVDWVDYYDHLPQATVFASDPKKFKDCWIPGNFEDLLYLGSTLTPPAIYYPRLHKLLLYQQQPLVGEQLCNAREYLVREAIDATVGVCGWDAVHAVLDGRIDAYLASTRNVRTLAQRVVAQGNTDVTRHALDSLRIQTESAAERAAWRASQPQPAAPH